MEKRKKRALLARIDSHLAATESAHGSELPKYRQRVQWAFDALAELPLDDVEAAYRERMQFHLLAFFDMAAGESAWREQGHRNMLARADCVLWQMYLRRRAAPSTASLYAKRPAA